MPLDTARLHLRPPVVSGAHPYTHADLRVFFDHVVPREPTWATLWCETSRLIGIMGLAPAPADHALHIGLGDGIVGERYRFPVSGAK